jgi:hypothetical protein
MLHSRAVTELTVRVMNQVKPPQFESLPVYESRIVEESRMV